MQVEQHDEEIELRLAGDLDVSSADAFSGELQRLEEEEAAVVRLDLSGLDFIDSTGLRLIAELYQRCLRQRRVLWIVPGPPNVQRLFQVTLLDQTLPFVAD